MRSVGWIIALVAIVELGAQAWTSRRAPAFERYEEIVPALDAMRRPGDAVLMAPAWAEPVLRAAAGDARLRLADVARPDLDDYEAVVEVSALGAERPELEGWPELERARAGPFSLRRLSNPGHVPVAFDFTEHLVPGRVEVSAAGRRCPFTQSAHPRAGGLGGHPTFVAARFDCPGNPFIHASVTVIADHRFRPRRCLWAHPPATGALSLRYGDVPLGDEIVGHSGMYWIIERERRGAPVELVVRIAGEALASIVHRDGDGWSRFEVGLGRHAGTTADVELSVRSPDYRHRHFCFEARTR